MNKLFAFFVVAPVMLMACGQGNVSITEATYQTKIVIQGVLVPGHIPQVKLRRNFPLNAVVDPAEIPLRDASVTITDEEGVEYDLSYNPVTRSYEVPQLEVEYGKTYTLNADATIDGQALHASSTTTVPNAGFKILEDQSRLGKLFYRQRDDQGNIINFKIVFERSPGTGYYLVSIVAIDPDTSNYIYDNPYNDNTPADVLADFEEYKYNYYWIQDRPLTAGVSSTKILWLYIYFYCKYRVIIYAADRNLRDFQSTHEVVQGIDGNFHEPAFHIEGDGIGVFGSAVVDTAYFDVLRP